MRPLWLGLFWVCAGTIAYVYLGYPLLMALWARLCPRPHHCADIFPPITLIIPAYNEAECIVEKLRNSLALSYPSDSLEILVVTDGSDDGTECLAASLQDPRIHVLHHRQSSSGGPRGRGRAGGSARLYRCQRRALDHRFDPPRAPLWRPVGGRCGRGETRAGLGRRGFVLALREHAKAVGELCKLGDGSTRSVIQAPNAIAREDPSTSLRASWERRVRNAAGGWQGIIRLGHPKRHASLLTWWQCLSHRGLRWMVVPWLWLPLMIASIALARHPFYLAVCLAQWTFYDLATIGGLLASHGTERPVVTAAFYLLYTNAAAAIGGCRYLMGRQPAAWKKVR